MDETPIKLTAEIHIILPCDETEIVSESRTEILNRLLAEASILQPDHQEILIHFADCLQKVDPKS